MPPHFVACCGGSTFFCTAPSLGCVFSVVCSATWQQLPGRSLHHFVQRSASLLRLLTRPQPWHGCVCQEVLDVVLICRFLGVDCSRDGKEGQGQTHKPAVRFAASCLSLLVLQVMGFQGFAS